MLNVLIGANGAGKSNFISLFVLLQQMIDKKLQSYVSRHGGPDSLLYFGNKETDALAAEFFFGKNGYRFVLTPTQDEQMMFERESFFGRSQAFTGSEIVILNHAGI